MIILAHDGSIYGDWVARYAIRFAAGESDRTLLALHVEDGQISSDIVQTRLQQLAKECDSINVEFIAQQLPLNNTVYRSLRSAIPHDPEALLVCGTRVKPRKRNYLTGTISEQLLRMHQCPVVSLRVVQPGLLGHPEHLLLPLAGHLEGVKRIWPVFRRLQPTLRSVHLFRSLYVSRLRHPHLSIRREALLRQAGNKYLASIASELEKLTGPRTFAFEQHASIAPEWTEDVLVHANRLKVQMMLLGVSERNLAYRVLHGVAVESILRGTPCDVGIYRGP